MMGLDYPVHNNTMDNNEGEQSRSFAIARNA